MAAMLVGGACATADAAAPTQGHPLASSLPFRSAPRLTPPVPTPSFTPGSSFLSGTIADIDLPEITVRTVDRGDVLVDVSAVRSVWRETFVTTSSLEPGDHVFIDGAGGDPFHALNVNANIDRIDAKILSIDGDTIELSVLRKPGASELTVRAVLSPFIVHDGPWRLADLHAGTVIGAVVYRAKDGSRRITRIWN